jgi:hypothetical protein
MLLPEPMNQEELVLLNQRQPGYLRPAKPFSGMSKATQQILALDFGKLPFALEQIYRAEPFWNTLYDT